MFVSSIATCSASKTTLAHILANHAGYQVLVEMCRLSVSSQDPVRPMRGNLTLELSCVMSS